MSNAASRALNAAIGRVLPERQVFIRSDRGCRYLHLTPVTQLGAVALLGAGLLWTAHATHTALTHTAETERAALTRAAVEKAWAAQHARLAETRDTLAADLAEAEADRRAAAEALAAAEAELVEAEAALKAATVERLALKRGLDRLQIERTRAAERAARLEATLHETRLALLEKATERGTAPDAGQMMSGAMLATAMATVVEERDAARERLAALDAERARLEAELSGWQERQGLVLEKIETAAKAGLSGLTKVLERADLDIDRILEETRANYTGSGGPFEPLTEEEAALLDGGEDDARVASLMADLERINLMRIAVDRLPFGMPVTAGVRLTSGFGKRRDPFRGRWSMHNGVDYAGPVGTPIATTAEGVVSFSGRMRGYGNVVIIKHSFGYETRYAHLKRSLVRVGDRVTRGDRIALMGSTGRSTGSHLHYEIRIDEDPINPKKFIEAARDVL